MCVAVCVAVRVAVCVAVCVAARVAVRVALSFALSLFSRGIACKGLPFGQHLRNSQKVSIYICRYTSLALQSLHLE